MKKKCLFKLMTLILTAALLLSLGVTAVAAGVQAVPNAATVLINNKTVAFEAYTIGGNNYFRLRDLAMAFLGSAERFSLEWDGEANAIRLMSDRVYNPIGGELKVTNSTSPVTAAPTTSQIYLDGKLIYAKAYVIGETNYFKLRDIGAAMNFSVTYDSKTTSIKIDTTKEYYMPALMEILPDANYYSDAGIIFFNRTEVGSITITRYSYNYYNIASINISSADDLTKLKSIVGVFVSTPDQVVDAVESSKTEGQKILQIDGKTYTCTYVGQTMAININW